ncbi:hypothetical protein GpartN1_g7153.t1 [Galdieria partita]|uniref:UBX domain-containing protein n=1 Tax=Galdieria partita TaxID=83374 RepID=A0A9C7Q4G3_9RHOD|nr:hypothetical protein GpartN1_g7153.t1 [Galdieria partita]
MSGGENLETEANTALLDSLPQDKKEFVETFMSVTRCQSVEEAVDRLESVGWNLERAVDLHISGESFPVTRPSSSSQNGLQNDSIRSQQEAGVGVISQTGVHTTSSSSRPSTLFQMTISFFLAPLRALLKAAASLLRLLFVGPRSVSRPRIEVARRAAREFAQQFESEYGSIHPTFFQGCFLDALNYAKQQFKFVLVYLHADRHYLTPDFCRDVLTNEQLVGFINENFIFWACSLDSAEGRHLQVSFRATDFPFIAIVTVAQGRRNAQVLESKQGAMESDELTEFLVQTLERHGEILNSARLEQQRQLETRQIREEQDVAFQRAIEEDRARLEAVAQEEAARKEEEARLEREKQEAELERERLERRRQLKLQEIEEEPIKGDSDTVTIAIRHSDGSRIERRFRKENTIRQVFDWLDIRGIDIDKICLVCNFPKRHFDYTKDGHWKLREIDQGPHLVFFIEDK